MGTPAPTRKTAFVQAIGAPGELTPIAILHPAILPPEDLFQRLGDVVPLMILPTELIMMRAGRAFAKSKHISLHCVTLAYELMDEDE